MTPHRKIKLVACEGNDDRLVMQALADAAGYGSELKFEDYANSGTLRKYLATLRVRPDFTSGQISSVLVTRDADSQPDAAWDSLRDAVSAIFSVELLTPGAWIELPGGPRFCGWVVPGSHAPGMIETLFLDAVRETHAEVFTCLDPLVECLKSTQGIVLHEKARFHLWTILAQKPGAQDRLSLAKAMERMPPDWQAAAFASLTDILRQAAE
jgi:hypothetical protein